MFSGEKTKLNICLFFRTRTQNIHVHCIAVYIRTTIHWKSNGQFRLGRLLPLKVSCLFVWIKFGKQCNPDYELLQASSTVGYEIVASEVTCTWQVLIRLASSLLSYTNNDVPNTRQCAVWSGTRITALLSLDVKTSSLWLGVTRWLTPASSGSAQLDLSPRCPHEDRLGP